MSQICVVGTGYVGLVTAACLADLGNFVVALDSDKERIDGLKRGLLPIYEPGLEELVQNNAAAGRLSFTGDYAQALAGAEFAFVAVGTPSGVDGDADLHFVRAAVESIARTAQNPLIVVNKSTVPVGTGDWVTEVMLRQRSESLVTFSVVSNPEFLREGSAVHDFMNPDRIVLGASDPGAAQQVAELYAPLRAPVLVTDLRTAEMIKYASNAFLATRISFINEIATTCEELGADVRTVALGMGYDQRIGHSFLDAGLGWGGSCFPKDVKALEHMAVLHGAHPQLLQAVMEINRNQRRRAVMRLRQTLGGSLREATLGVLGLSFKPNTDDIRESPAIDLIHLLQNEGALVRAYDPRAMHNATSTLREVVFCQSPYEAAEGADALILATEWNEFKQLDFAKLRELMRHPVLFDGRNFWPGEVLIRQGFVYLGVGQGQLNPLSQSSIAALKPLG